MSTAGFLARIEPLCPELQNFKSPLRSKIAPWRTPRSEIGQQNLGHASPATTTVYVKTEEKRRMRAVKKFWQERAGQ